MKLLWSTLVSMMMKLLIVQYAFAEKKTYIIQMDKSSMPVAFEHHSQWYVSCLKSASESAQLIYTYDTVIHGYSAMLTAEEAESIKSQPLVLSIQEEVVYKLHTTRSPEFLGLENTKIPFPGPKAESDVIVGVLDTGVWPESKSFDDTGLGPVPSTWKGKCEVRNNFNLSNCNRKLIGARVFFKGYEAIHGPIDESKESKSPRDDNGHGSHTTSTVAGAAVSGASFLGYAKGTARGMAVHARVAVYKACWKPGCFNSDILAAMEAAIDDGVHMLSLSFGGQVNYYYADMIAVAAFAAMSRGILVSCSAGNDGSSGTVTNVAPWITTVGAGTLDRTFPAYVSLGDGQNFSSVSLYSGKPLPKDSLLPVVYAGYVSNSTYGNLCMLHNLPREKVAGKIVVCDRGMGSRVMKGIVVKKSGGVGMILANTAAYGEQTAADPYLTPAAAVGQKSGDAIKKYISSNSNPKATILFAGTELGVQPSPVVAFFSSRGPNSLTPGILKPDLMAPGVDILAAWNPTVSPSDITIDHRRVNFNIISGTSMSCPHVSGLAALLKAAHPKWSPAAIRSALMTTAYSTYKNGKTIQDVMNGILATPFDYGAGHVNPGSALDPGLVYDASVKDYISFLCALNYTSTHIKTLTKQNVTCKFGKKYRVEDLNYPSFAVPLKTTATAMAVVKHKRVLTNVGSPASYKVSVSGQIPAVKIMVEPEVLKFSELNEKKRYTVTFMASSLPSGTTGFARLEWSDGKHIVGSPIAFTWT